MARSPGGPLEGLLTGLAWLLHGAGVATFSPDTVYDGSGWAVAIASVPEQPSRLVVLTPYTPVDDPQGVSSCGVQVRFRGDADPRTVIRRSEAVFGMWHELADVEIGGVPVSLMYRTSGASLGLDDNGRQEWSDNYRVLFDRPVSPTN